MRVAFLNLDKVPHHLLCVDHILPKVHVNEVAVLMLVDHVFFKMMEQGMQVLQGVGRVREVLRPHSLQDEKALRTEILHKLFPCKGRALV